MYTDVEEILKMPLEEIRKLHLQFEQWKEVYPSCTGKLLTLVLEKMEGIDLSFYQWHQKVYFSDSSGEQLKALALKKMAEIASSLDQWKIVLHHSSPDSELEVLALEKISKMNLSFDEWFEIWESSKPDNKLNMLAWKKMEEKKSPLANWQDWYNQIRSNPKQRTQILEKVKEIDFSFAEWRSVSLKRCDYDEALQELTSKMMKEKASTMTEWLRAHHLFGFK